MSPKRVKREELVQAPCQEACPAGIDVPRYVRFIREGRFEEALAVIREKIPFPAVCGFACYSPCESSCGKRQFGDPIAIRALKRSAAELGGELWKKALKVAPKTGKKVAIVGSGPSGLTAAYYLALLGHSVSVFEALPEPGGMMRYGIPSYRLPKDTLDAEISYLKELGVEILTNKKVESLEELQKQGFQAIYLALGAQRGAKLGVPGEDLPGVMDGIAFLRKVNGGELPHVGKRVAVIGGGNTAVDAARSALRLGADEVTIFYRRSRAEMPAYEEEVGAALAEGVGIEFLASPVKIEARDGKLEVTFTKMQLGKPDSSGRATPVPVKGSEFMREFDTLIAAVGQVPETPKGLGVDLTDGGFVKVDSETLSTGKPGVFAGGDLATGPKTIIDAIAQGRKAASSIDIFLGGKGIIDQELAPREEEVIVVDYDTEGYGRVSLPCIPIEERRRSFASVEKALSEGMAIKEAARCLSCDARRFEVVVDAEGCKECGYCVEVCGMGVFEPAPKFNKKGYRPYVPKKTERCVGCMLCFYACPDFSIEVKEA
jgi:NADPH-dependent glutamate synthase beta subunit-like oxidoreductase